MADPQYDPAVANDLTALFLKLSHNPKTRKIIAKAIKEGAPDSRHAQAFADVDVDDKFEAFRSEQEERETKRQQQEILARMNARRAALLNGGPDGEAVTGTGEVCSAAAGAVIRGPAGGGSSPISASRTSLDAEVDGAAPWADNNNAARAITK